MIFYLLDCHQPKKFYSLVVVLCIMIFSKKMKEIKNSIIWIIFHIQLFNETLFLSPKVNLKPFQTFI